MDVDDVIILLAMLEAMLVLVLTAVLMASEGGSFLIRAARRLFSPRTSSPGFRAALPFFARQTRPSAAAPESPPVRRAWQRLGRQAAEGCLLGILVSLLGIWLGLDVFVVARYLPIFGGLLGGVLFPARTKRFLSHLLALEAAAVVILSYSPLPSLLIRQLFREDTLRPVPAIVVLAARPNVNGGMSGPAQDRALQAYSLLRQKYAPCLVVASVDAHAEMLQQQMAGLGLDYRIEKCDLASTIHNTHDEALAIAKLARERHWDTVILVTHPWHMRRAAATFEKAGLRVLCSPCTERAYHIEWTANPQDQLSTFQDWLHEFVGYQTYRLRGWL